MTEVARTRDVIAFNRGPTFTVSVPDSVATSGWLGGQGFNWVEPTGDTLMVAPTDGLAGGFAFWGSDESSDEYTAMTRNQPTYKVIVLCAGGWIISTSTYEQYTYTSRLGGPLVPLVYSASDRLTFSLRGYWTKEDEWTLSGDPRAPNTNYYGHVVQRPTSARNNYLTLQVII